VPPKIKRGMWTNEVLEEAMDVIENGAHSIRRPTSHGTSQ